MYIYICIYNILYTVHTYIIVYVYNYSTYNYTFNLHSTLQHICVQYQVNKAVSSTTRMLMVATTLGYRPLPGL